MPDETNTTAGKETGAVPATEAAASAPEAEREMSPETNHNGNSLAEKRGRMIAAGAITTIILSVIAVVVAGVFHLTAHWTITCPKDLPVNDPAPVLWKELTAEKSSPGSLGVPEGLQSQTGLKAANPSSK